MPIKFKAVAMSDPTDRSAPKKYYAKALSSNKIELKDLAKRISAKSTTVSDIDTQAVLMALTQELVLAVQNGETVHLGDLGYFHTTVTGKGAKDAKSLSSSDIEAAHLRFVAGKEIESSLKTAKFEKVQ